MFSASRISHSTMRWDAQTRLRPGTRLSLTPCDLGLLSKRYLAFPTQG